MYQDTRNGTPSAWGHGPFTGLTPFPADDNKLGSSGQSIAMIMARYQIDPQWEISGGLRANRWSGAYAVITKPMVPPDQYDQWNEMFNVDWGCKSEVPSRCDVDNPGYAARSLDLMMGARYRFGQLGGLGRHWSTWARPRPTTPASAARATACSSCRRAWNTTSATASRSTPSAAW